MKDVLVKNYFINYNYYIKSSNSFGRIYCLLITLCHILRLDTWLEDF